MIEDLCESQRVSPLRSHLRNPNPPPRPPSRTAAAETVVVAAAGVVEEADELCVLGDEFAERQPALAALARAAVSSLLPAGPERRSRPPLGLAGRPGVEIAAPLSIVELGFSLHAATTASGDDARYPMHGPHLDAGD